MNLEVVLGQLAGPSVAPRRGCAASTILFFDLFECVRHVLIRVISAHSFREECLGIKCMRMCFLPPIIYFVCVKSKSTSGRLLGFGGCGLLDEGTCTT